MQIQVRTIFQFIGNKTCDLFKGEKGRSRGEGRTGHNKTKQRRDNTDKIYQEDKTKSKYPDE